MSFWALTTSGNEPHLDAGTRKGRGEGETVGHSAKGYSLLHLLQVVTLSLLQAAPCAWGHPEG